MVSFNYSVYDGIAENFEVPLQGHKIEAGESKNRVDLAGFKIAGRVIKESGNSLNDALVRFFGTICGYYVEVKGQNDEVLLLNVSSLSKRILLDKKTIKESAKLGQLESNIEGKVKELNGIISNYKKQVNWTKVHKDLTAEVLIKVIETALESKNGVIRFNIGDKRAKEEGLKRKKFFVYVDQDKNIIIKQQIKVLGKGGYGKVKLWVSADGTEEVFKQARTKFPGASPEKVPKMQTKATVDLQREPEVLNYIHSDGKCIGIEDAPSRVIQIQAPIYEVIKNDKDVQLISAKPEGKAKIQMGIIKIKFDGDYAYVVRLPFKTALLHSLQLLAGGKFLADKEVLHGDIKPGNIFIKGRYAKIADFGGACKANEEADVNRIFRMGESRACTRHYLNYNDVMEGEYLVKENNKEELVRLEKKGDAFSLGIILYDAFTGAYPYAQINEYNSSPVTASYIGFKANPEVPKEVQEIINGLLLDDYKARFSCEEAFFLLLKYVQENHPDIAQEFNEMLQGYREI